MVLKRRAAASAVQTAATRQLDDALLVLLGLTALTGLLPHALRGRELLGMLLLLHLGVVLGLFPCIPSGQLLHRFSRISPLLRHCLAQRHGPPSPGPKPTFPAPPLPPAE